MSSLGSAPPGMQGSLGTPSQSGPRWPRVSSADAVVRLAVVVAVAFLAELGIMLLFAPAGGLARAMGSALQDSAILALLVGPALYLAIYRPLARSAAEKTRARAALEYSEHLYRSTIDSIADIVLVVDGKGALRLCNMAAQKIGLCRGLDDDTAATGLACPQLGSGGGAGGRVWLDERNCRLLELVKQTQGGLLDKAAERSEQRLLAVADSPYEIAHRPLLGGEAAGGSIIVLRNVTMRHQREERIRKLSQAVEQSANVVIITQATGEIEFVNTRFEEVTGWSSDEVRGKNPRLLRSGHTPLSTYEEMWRTITTGGVFRGELRNRRKDGSLYWASMAVSGVRDARGAITHYIGIQEDITARKAAQDTLENKLAELDAFAYAIAHDLKAPLYAIERLASWIEADLGDRVDEQTKGHLVKLQGRSRRMAALIDAILRYARLGRDKEPLEWVDTGALVREVIDARPPPPGIRIEIPESLPTVPAHRVHLHQVFANLIDNAVKFHDKSEGHVAIRCVEVDTWFAFSVADDGPGIDGAYHAKIFEFLQTLQPRDEVESTGIGLALVKKVVEAVGGAVTVESVLGAGATFSFTWPRQMVSLGRPIDRPPR